MARVHYYLRYYLHFCFLWSDLITAEEKANFDFSCYPEYKEDINDSQSHLIRIITRIILAEWYNLSRNSRQYVNEARAYVAREIKDNQGVRMPWHLRAVIIIRGEEKRRAASISHREKRTSKETRTRNDARASRRNCVRCPCTSEWDERLENMAMIFTNSASAWKCSLFALCPPCRKNARERSHVTGVGINRSRREPRINLTKKFGAYLTSIDN